MGKFSYAGRLLQEFVAFAREKKMYWIVPFVLVLFLVALLVIAGSGATPFIYTLF